MAKITNELQDLKKKADDMNISYQKNAGLDKMKELLGETEEKKGVQAAVSNTPKQSPETVTIENYQELLKNFENLKDLVENTTDTNKMKAHERSKDVLNNFAFSVKLYVEEDESYPITSWNLKSNYVAQEESKIVEKQIIEITYLKEGQEKSKKIPLVEFSRTLKRSPKILANDLKNIDGSDVHISQQINAQTKLQYYVMQPKDLHFIASLTVEGQEVEISSKYLNA